MSETLSNQGTKNVVATEYENVAGQMTPILGFSPKDGLLLEVMDGGGIPLVMDLRDANGDPLPLDTEFTMEYEAPHHDKPQTVSERISNLQVWRALAIKDQQNDEYRDQTRVGLKEGYRAVEVRDIDEFYLSVNSSAAIDWSQSRVYIAKEHTSVTSED